MSDPHPHSQALERPRTLTYAVYGMWLGGVLEIASLLSLFTLDTAELESTMISEIEGQPTYDSSTLDAQQLVDVLIPIIVVGGAVLALLSMGLWIWMAVMNGRGRNWARVTATVFGALALAGSLSSLGSAAGSAALGSPGVPGSPLSMVFAVVDPLLAITILVLLWLRPSSAYFAAVSAARQQQRHQQQGHQQQTGYYAG
ncbi:hypothetical protein J2S40_003625 [Nocardioides luteus]|uniref:hypothetical protein n=1 Tax=Nocardioides luteus TaxID=1844 RepID=UPI0028655C7F|nr:hypothetical protein [Nocardioides luteus]MDR7312567.1 hypothetical protein [Nocardioides luteus]